MEMRNNKIIKNHEIRYVFNKTQHWKNFGKIGYFLDLLKQAISTEQRWKSIESAKKYVDKRDWVCDPMITRIHERPEGLENRYELEWQFPIIPVDKRSEKHMVLVSFLCLFHIKFPNSNLSINLKKSFI